VKFRRRREGFTDYRQRHKLITQDKNKYGSPKYRLVVRITNRYVICQIIMAEITGDKVLCAATSKELAKHGLKVGLKNFSAAYCTGLLLARRLLKKLNLHEVYNGQEEPTGEVITCTSEVNGRTYYVDKLDKDGEGNKPFRAILDVGIKNTTTGARIFAAMKGASDGGIDIPHSHKRFPGYSRDTKTFDAASMKNRIMGEHVADYMREMEEDDEENYKKHFKLYLDEDLDADGLEDLYEKVHQSIREDPEREAVEKYVPTKEGKKTVKKSAAQRKADAAAKKASFQNAGDEDEEAEEEDE